MRDFSNSNLERTSVGRVMVSPLRMKGKVVGPEKKLGGVWRMSR